MNLFKTNKEVIMAYFLNNMEQYLLHLGIAEHCDPKDPAIQSLARQKSAERKQKFTRLEILFQPPN